MKKKKIAIICAIVTVCLPGKLGLVQASPVKEPAVQTGYSETIVGKAGSQEPAPYLVSLFKQGQYVETVQFFEKLGLDWQKLPAEGLQAAGDAYFRLQKYQEARTVYEFLLADNADFPYAKISYAYCLLKLGQGSAALTIYSAVAQESPQLHRLLAEEGKNLIANGKRTEARQLFALLGRTAQEKAHYQYIFAEALAEGNLVDDGYYHESMAIFRQVAATSCLEAQGLLGMLKNKVRKGLYADSEKIMRQVAALEGAEKELAAAQSFVTKYRRQGNAFSYAHLNRDYKGNDLVELSQSVEQYQGHNTYGLGDMGFIKYKDAGGKVILRRMGVGVNHRFDQGHLIIWGHALRGTQEAEFLSVKGHYEFSDKAQLGYVLGRRPYLAVGAIKRDISENYYHFNYQQRINEKTSVEASYEYSKLSDQNNWHSYGLRLKHNLELSYSQQKHLLLKYQRGSFAEEKPWYESPYLRLSYGAGLSQKWWSQDKMRAFELTTMLEWSHDNAEPTDFTPWVRGEYVYSLSDKAHLTVGGAYGWRSDRLHNRNSMSQASYTFDLSYYWEW